MSLKIEIGNIINQIKRDKHILESELDRLGSVIKKGKDRSCVHCTSSDALKIDPKRNKYKCFSCGTGGSVFDLLIEVNNYSFFDALVELCMTYGIELPTIDYNDPNSKEYIERLNYKKQQRKLSLINKGIINDKNLDYSRKFDLSCMVDKLMSEELEELEELEAINHARYKANDVIKIDKYISEDNSSIVKLIYGAYKGETNLLIAPTGSGKSYTVIEALKKVGKKALFILPNTANVEQAMNEYNIGGAYGDLDPIEAMKNNKIVAMTWDKCSKLNKLTKADLKDYIVVVDEIHQTYTDTFRKEAINGLYRVLELCKGRIDITATPNKLDFNIYKIIIEYKKENKTQYNVKIYDNENTLKMIEIINNSKGSALLMNDIKELKYIRDRIIKSSEVVASETKEFSNLYDNIINNSHMGHFEVLLNTTTLVAGVNIYNPNITDIIVSGIKDIGTIVQYVARFRGLENANVHIFNTYSEKSNIYDLEYSIKENIKQAEALRDTYNTITYKKTPRELQLVGVGADIAPLNLDSNIYYDEINRCYEVDEIYIRSSLYRGYYNSRTIKSFKYLLHEYFEDIEIVNLNPTPNDGDKKEYKKDLKEAKEEALKQLEKYKCILVGYDKIRKDNLTNDLKDFYRGVGVNYTDLKKLYLKHDIEYKITEHGLGKIMTDYTSLVLKDGYHYELAWIIANMPNKTKGTFKRKLNYLVYKSLKEKYSDYLISQNRVETLVCNWLIKNVPIGTSYTQAHLKEICKDLMYEFGKSWSFTEKKVSEYLNKVYDIELHKNIRNATPIKYNFYKNIHSIDVANKKVTNIYTINSLVTIDSLIKKFNLDNRKKELISPISPKENIEYVITKKINNVLSSTDNSIFNELMSNIF